MAVIELTTQNFNEEVLQSDVPVMVDFWASWCGPCRMVSPIVDEIAEEVQGKAKVGKVNVDEQGDLASQFGVMSKMEKLLQLLLVRNQKQNCLHC